MDATPNTLPGWATLIAFLTATLAAGATGMLFQPGAWYRSLRKPSWTPPNQLFPIAWTLLYLAMAVAAWQVALAASPLVGPGLAFWSCQIVLNAIWSPIFFGRRRLGTGFAVIVAMWVAVALTTWIFWQILPAAGLLMAIYLAWISYAGALNLAVWRLNPKVEAPAAP